MLYVMIISIAVLMYVLTRLYFFKKEIKSTTRQLHELNKNVTEKKIDIRYFDRDFEKLAKEMAFM
ncbi:hypothetical protein AB1K32_17295 [Metabacillus dongyingensis]|uniref:hypothetical protein n=1 Tax=Metabacillus dongyingensis TaxID=2874282 RepID=UPI003B8B48CC